MSKIKKIILIIVIIILVYAIVQVVNAAKYKMLVNVKEGENIMGVNPLTDNLDFGDLSRNNGMTRYVNFTNNGKGSVFFVVFKFGEISDLVQTEKSSFTLKPGEEYKLPYTIQIPPSAEIKKYSGWTVIFRLPKFF